MTDEQKLLDLKHRLEVAEVEKTQEKHLKLLRDKIAKLQMKVDKNAP